MRKKRRNLNIWDEQAQEISEQPEFKSVGLSGLARILIDEALDNRKNKPITKMTIVAYLSRLNKEDLFYVLIEGLRLFKDLERGDLSESESPLTQWAIDFIAKQSGIKSSRLEELRSGELPEDDEILALTGAMDTDYKAVKKALGLRNGQPLSTDS